jgi:hypothetical protein
MLAAMILSSLLTKQVNSDIIEAKWQRSKYDPSHWVFVVNYAYV